MLRVVFVTSGLSTGGAEGAMLKILERIDRDRFEPMVISLTTIGEVGPRLRALGIRVEALEMNKWNFGIFGFLRLVFLLRSFRADVVQTWMYHADLVGGIAARLAGVSNVSWSLRNSNLSPELLKSSTLLVVRACAIFSKFVPKKVISCSVRAAEVHIDAGYAASKIHVIPNGFDLDRFKPWDLARASILNELDLPGDAILVGLMARFDPQKNHLGFIEAAALVRKILPNAHFILAGKDVDHSNSFLVKAIAQSNVSGCMHLLGRRDDMPRLMAGLDILASSSHGEAFPNVLGEAMACEVPCVVTNVGDSSQIVGDTGRIVAANDMLGLAAQIVELATLPSLAKRSLGKRARRRITEKYAIGEVTKRYEDFFEHLIYREKTCVD